MINPITRKQLLAAFFSRYDQSERTFPSGNASFSSRRQ